MQEQKLVSDYAEFQLAEDRVLECARNAEIEKVYGIFDGLYENIMKSSEEASWEKNILYSFRLAKESDREQYGIVLQMGYLDMTLRNAFYDDDELIWFDQEWALENVPAKYVLYRAVNELYVSYPEVQRLIPRADIDARYGLAEVTDQFRELDRLFFGVVIDRKHMRESLVFRGNGSKRDIDASIKRILSVGE